MSHKSKRRNQLVAIKNMRVLTLELCVQETSKCMNPSGRGRVETTQHVTSSPDSASQWVVGYLFTLDRPPTRIDQGFMQTVKRKRLHSNNEQAKTAGLSVNAQVITCEDSMKYKPK
jgi:hypothetical protein